MPNSHKTEAHAAAPDDPFRFADELGPEKLVHLYNPATDLKAIVVIDNVACGPAIGGVRMAPDVSTEECFRLARAMSLKNVSAGLSHGGGKSVIFADPKRPLAEKERLIRAFACAIRDLTDYIPGPDMGTDERCMAWIQDEIGRSVGLPAEIGGIPLDEVGATALGVVVAAEVAQEFCAVELAGARVAVQGFGSVGLHAARFFAEKGAILVAASDSHGTIYDADGLDVDRLVAVKKGGASVTEIDTGKRLAPDAVIDVDCDIWIPAARPDIIDSSSVDRLKAKLVVQGANIPITGEAEEILYARGVLSIPDFIANAGGVICGAVEYQGGSEAAALRAIDEKIRQNTRRILEESKSTKKRPREAALALAKRRLDRAMAYRRWS